MRAHPWPQDHPAGHGALAAPAVEDGWGVRRALQVCALQAGRQAGCAGRRL